MAYNNDVSAGVVMLYRKKCLWR